MKAREYFKRLRIKEVIYKQAVEEAEELIRQENGVRGIMYSERVQTSTESDLGDLLVKREKIIKKAEQKKEEYLEYRNKVIENLEKLSDERYIELLYKKELKRMTYNEIAKEMHLGKSRLKELNRMACSELERNILNCPN